MEDLKPFEWTEKSTVEVLGVTFIVTPTKNGNFAFFVSLDKSPDIQSGDFHRSFGELIEIIEEAGFKPRVSPDRRTVNYTGIKAHLGLHMVYANRPSFKLIPKEGGSQ